jgi:hypothetical protein
MKGCDDYSATIQLYLDRELSGHDLEDFRALLDECKARRTELEAEERLSALLQRSRPLYSAQQGSARARGGRGQAQSEQMAYLCVQS